ncbi:TetR-like C-terminal domain-containing protein [Actinospica robiniae]|uniref:TetR-like C-terminal domain-containing protein n=1 Tax=Actinospica robiniae TaxID=304901 RepID=UPI0004206852|nr:TetR-like C-terminal domain-containing protein [Actinospica robiniae]
MAQAAEVADEAGLGGLTLAAVARRCGVSLPGLYKHVVSLEAVRRDVAVLAVRELAAVLALATTGRSGRDALAAACGAYRDYALAHPGRAASLAAAPTGGDEEHNAAAAQAGHVFAAVLLGYGVEGGDLVDAIRLLRVTMHGFAMLESAGGFGLPQSVDATFARLVDMLDGAFRSWGDPRDPA